MKYLLLMYANEADAPNTLEEQQAAAPAWSAFRQGMEDAGVLLSSRGLAPVADATTVRLRNGTRLITGTFAETHEQWGGCVLLDCKDLDEAIGWAARIPTANYGSVEIRPLWLQK